MKKLIIAIIYAVVVAFLGYVFVLCITLYDVDVVSHVEAWGVYLSMVIAGFGYYFGNKEEK